MKVILLILFSLNLQAKTIKVMIIDSGVSLSHTELLIHAKDPKNEYDYDDPIGHGTHIAGLVVKNTCLKIELISCRYINSSTNASISVSNSCLKRALEEKIDYINYSSGGQDFNLEEYNLFKKIISSGIKVIVSAGNERVDLSKNCNYYPACYRIPGMTIVGSKNNGKKAYYSNYGLKEMKWEEGTDIISTLPQGQWGKMSGTSQATAIRTNRLLRKECQK